MKRTIWIYILLAGSLCLGFMAGRRWEQRSDFTTFAVVGHHYTEEGCQAIAESVDTLRMNNCLRIGEDGQLRLTTECKGIQSASNLNWIMVGISYAGSVRGDTKAERQFWASNLASLASKGYVMPAPAYADLASEWKLAANDDKPKWSGGK